MSKSTITNFSRTFDLAFTAPLWNPLRVTITADCQGVLSAEINDVPAELETALIWLGRAQLAGHTEVVCEGAPFAGKPAAHRLHILLGELGYRHHYALAAEVLGRPVSSLANLRPAELALVSSYAHGQLGLVG